jgi:hypothetical protein
MIIELNSVGSVIDDETLIAYPKYMKGGYDKDSGTYLTDISNEWFEALSLDDKMVVNELIYQIKNKRNDSK